MDEPHVFDTVLMPETIDPVVIANINRAADTVDDVDIKGKYLLREKLIF
jgi:hypothetical protein